MTKIAFTAALLLGTCLALTPAMAQRSFDYSKVEEKAVDLGHGVFGIIPTSDDPAMAIGCTTIAVGSDGIIVVDTQFPALYNKIRAAIRQISPLPVKYRDQHPRPWRSYRRQRQFRQGGGHHRGA